MVVDTGQTTRNPIGILPSDWEWYWWMPRRDSLAAVCNGPNCQKYSSWFQLACLPLLSRRTLLPASACGTAFARLILGCDEAHPDLVLEETVLSLYLDVTEYTCAAGSSPGAACRCRPVVAAIRPARPRASPQRDMHHLKELRSVNVGWPCVCHLRDSLDRVPVSSVYLTDIFSIASDISFGQILEQCGGNSQIIPAKPHQVKVQKKLTFLTELIRPNWTIFGDNLALFPKKVFPDEEVGSSPSGIQHLLRLTLYKGFVAVVGGAP
ncbi:hypothetical protein B0H14DRAFT_3128313 [Mycena olivaceomarginata]|nr:hypothetical protein B0H14DRAFT_3128313 [Mycena olivaceomarginata]